MENLYIPKYQEIINALRSEIAGGALQPGDKLPVREELQEKYGVARTTIERAIRELTADGTLTASRRNGTFVADPITDKIALITWGESVNRQRPNWHDPHNYFSMFGIIIEKLGDRCEVITPDQVRKNPEALRRYRRIMWHALKEEEFERAVAVVGDRSRFILLNRSYPDTSAIYTDHRTAAFDLLRLFLENLPKVEFVGIIDVPESREFPERVVWESRLNGFADACEKHRRFYRIIELKEDDFDYNIEKLSATVGKCTAAAPGILVSPSRMTSGSVLGFFYKNDLRFNREYYYADFDNDRSRQNCGLPITTMVQDFAAIAGLAVNNCEKEFFRIVVPHQIKNNPFQQG